MAKLLCLALLCAALTGAFAQYPSPPPYGAYPPTGVYSPPPYGAPAPTPPGVVILPPGRNFAPPSPPMPPMGSNNVTGFARFVGPLSAGCSVVADTDSSTAFAGVSGVGVVSVGQLVPVRVLPGAACVDTFTGVPIPFSAGGDSQTTANFQVSVTNMIGMVNSTQGMGASYSYFKMGEPGAFETVDVYDAMRKGNLTAWSMLTADLKMILATTTMAHAFIANAPNGSTCGPIDAAARAFAVYVNSLGNGAWDVAQVRDAATSMMSTCGVDASATTVTAIASAASPILKGLSTPTLMAIPQAFALPTFAAFGSWLSTANLSVLTTVATSTNGTALLAEGLNNARIVPSAIATALGIAATPDTATTISATLVGPLAGATIAVEPWYNTVWTTLASTVGNALQTAATTTNPAGTFAIYNVTNGTDLFLTGDPAKPVTSTLQYQAVLGFTNGANAVFLGPMAGLVGAGWELQQINITGNVVPVPTAVVPGDFLKAYTTIIGPNTLDPNLNYMQRNLPAGSKEQLLVMMADAVVAGTVGLISTFINGVIADQPGMPSRSYVTRMVFEQFVNQGNVNYTSSGFITNATQAVFSTTGASIPVPASPSPAYPTPYGAASPPYPPPAYPPPSPPYSMYPPPPPPTPRQRFDAIVANFATSVASANGLLVEYTAKINTATGRRLLQSSNNAIGISQAAAVQQSDMTAAAQAIATALAAGNYAAAEAAAQAFATNFSGANLRNLANSKVVNTAAINAATGVTTQSGGKDNKLALGLGIGLGLGIPVLAAIIAGAVMYVKSRREEQTTAPAATAEGTVFDVAQYGNGSVVEQESAPVTQFFRTRVAAEGYSRPTHM